MAEELFDVDSGYRPPLTPDTLEGDVYGFGNEPKKVHRVSNDAEFEALEGGSHFIDPQGNKRIKPYTVKSDFDYKNLEEGAQFYDPEGNVREKPKYEDVNYTANTLYNMAVNEKERKKALALGYPKGKIEQDEMGEFYVEDEEGKRRKPRGFMGAPGSAITAGAATTIGSTAGGIAGGVLGAGGGAIAGAPTGPGIVATVPAGATVGAMSGAWAGGALGEQFNSLVLQLAGVRDRTIHEEAAHVGAAGLVGAIGEGAGRAIFAIPAAGRGMRNMLPAGIAKILGAQPAEMETAAELAKKGVLVPASSWAKEAPHIQNVTEVLDPAFRTQKPLQQSAAKYYEEQAQNVLKELGIESPGSVTKPEAAVPLKETGEALIRKVTEESARADADLAAQLEARKVIAGMAPREDSKALLQSAAEARQAAQKVIDTGFEDIDKAVGEAFKFSEKGHNGGDLWTAVGEKLRAFRQGIVERHNLWYNQADEAAGGILPDSSHLPQVARQFLDQLPEDFAGQYPSIIQRIEALAGKQNPKTGEWIKEPEQPTFGQLHNLRSVLRNNVDWYKLNSDFKNGSYKFFAKAVDNVLENPGAAPELQAASKLLAATDKSYGENMSIFNAKNLNAIMRGLESGEPADPVMLFNAIVKEGHSDLTAKIMDMIGPSLAAGVRAADVQSMLQNSRSLFGGIDGAAFVREVLGRQRSDLLHAVHGEQMGNKLIKQAQLVSAQQGKIPINVQPGDTAMDIVIKARAAQQVAEQAAKVDPLSALNKEMRLIDNEHKRNLAKLQRDRKDTALGFLYDPTFGAVKAVEKILGSEDLIIAAARQFGPNSPEFNMLRQVYAENLFRSTMRPGEKLAGMSPEVQNIMFPGMSLDHAKLLAKEMDFLTHTKGGDPNRAGKSIMATEAVEHPLSRIGGGLTKYIPKVISGPADVAARAILTQYYKVVTNLASNPAFLSWLAKGLKGDPAAREIARQELQNMMQRGGATGAAIMQGQYQLGRQEAQQEP